MTELKTLKDLEHIRISTGNSIGKSGATDVSIILLRQEAIKWIKQLSNQNSLMNSYSKLRTGYTLQHITQTISWIKHFFNITEEELK